MIIKEYRIVFPMSIDDYKIGQLYTIQKKSQLESEGAGGGVEIKDNKPYENETEKGQYTLKVYHVDRKLPQSLKLLTRTLFPKSALLFEEEGWNCYPYTRTKYRHPLFKNFLIDVETIFRADLGDCDNVFNLDKNDLSNRTVEYIDFVNDQISPAEYKKEEDPNFFCSFMNNRGPLTSNWFDELKRNDSKSPETARKDYLCAYKLCKIECKYWGIQTKLEKTICDSVLRKMLLITHRQAWCWQDEYTGLTIEDIRQLEIEAQRLLELKMNSNLESLNSLDSANPYATTSPRKSTHDVQFKIKSQESVDKMRKSESILVNDDDNFEDGYDNDDTLELEAVETKSNGSDEFYDAVSQRSFDTKSKDFISIASSNQTNSDNDRLRDSSSSTSSQSLHRPSNLNLFASCKEQSVDTLILVVHGGNVMTNDNTQQNDFSNLKSTFERLINCNYSDGAGRIAYRLVCCEPLCKDALLHLSDLCPLPESNELPSDIDHDAPVSLINLFENIPLNTLPLFACANKPDYNDKLVKFIRDCNQVYREFINSYEGSSFDGEVIVIGDSNGSLIAYDALCSTNYLSDEISQEQFPVQNSDTHQSLPVTPSSAKLNVDKSPQYFITQRSYPCGSDNDTNRNQLSTFDDQAKNLNMKDAQQEKLMTSSQWSGSMLSFRNDNLEFNVTHFFSFGSPLGLVLAYRKYATSTVEKPACKQVFNLFHLNDPNAIRIEPLLCKTFRNIKPCTVSRYSKFPFGDGLSTILEQYIIQNSSLFDINMAVLNQNPSSPQGNTVQIKETYMKSFENILKVKNDWWGDHRIDYILYSPEKITNLPKQSLPYLFHSSYWESTDAVAFILRRIFQNEKIKMSSHEPSEQEEPTEKLIHRFNRVKLKKLAPNHRANDVIVLEDKRQILNAKFLYGPFDFELSGEKVNIFIKSNSTNVEYINTWAVTDNHGRLKYEIPDDKRLPQGMYSIQMVVKHDKSSVEFNMVVLPPNTETVVFSITGSFVASISVTGNDPKVHPGSVDIVRFWQDLGYLIIYVSARPDMQQPKVLNWLKQHNFPFGMVFFSDGISTGPIKQKALTLKNLVTSNELYVKAGYGSMKDLQMYTNLGLRPNQIFIIGKANKKYLNQSTILSDGYASHLKNLKTYPIVATGNARLILKKIPLNQNTSPSSYQVVRSIVSTNEISEYSQANDNFKRTLSNKSTCSYNK